MNITLTLSRFAAHRRRLRRRRPGPRRVLLDRASRHEGRECVRARLRWSTAIYGEPENGSEEDVSHTHTQFQL